MPEPQQPLDDVRYQDGTHAQPEHFERWNAGKMPELEESIFLHHLEECPTCTLRFRDWIGATDIEKPGPSSDGRA